MITPRFDMIDNGNGTWTVKDVPIFAVCKYGPREFKESWVDSALANMLAEQKGGHVYPMHIHHTTDETAVVEPAGAFKVTRKGDVRLRDKVVPGLIGDLTFTSANAAQRCKDFQLLWRSPEIPKSGPERLRSLALLDREAPHLPMEILAVRQAAAQAGTKYEPEPAASWSLASGDAVLAFSARGESLFALMEPLTMAVHAAAAPAPSAKPKFRRMADGTMVPISDVVAMADEKPAGDGPPKPDVEAEGAKPEGDGDGESEEKPESKGDPVDALLEKIKGLKLTREQHQKLEAGIAEIFKDDAAAPVSDTPGDVTMKEPEGILSLREDLLKTSKRLAVVETSSKARDEADARKAAADRGMARLEGRAVPSDQRSRLIAFAEKHGTAAVDGLVDDLVASLPPVTLTLGDSLSAGKSDASAPAEVLAFHAKGPDAFEAAQKAARLHATLMKTHWAGSSGMSLKDFLDLKVGDGARAFRTNDDQE